jgi:hypothetical protein
MVKLGAYKTKSRVHSNVTDDIPQSNHVTAGGVFESLFSSAGSMQKQLVTESIAYTTKPRAERHRANFCRHIRDGRTYLGSGNVPVRLTFTTPGHVGHYVDYYGANAHASAAHNIAISTAYGASQLNVPLVPVYYGNSQDDIDAVFMQLRPDLTKLSLPNFLLELDDVGKLFQLWKRKLSTAKNVAGAHLNYKFGWKPLMADIRAMADVLRNLIQRLEDFEKACGVVQKSHAHISTTSTAKQGSTPYLSVNTVNWSGTVSRTKSAGLIYRPEPFQVIDGYDKMLRAYLDALGFELNPRILWDALPFTFVLDWFFGIGSWLERHKYDALELPFLYVDSYVQYREIVQLESRLTMVRTDTTPASFTLPPTVTSRIYYERIPSRPTEDGFNTVGWRMPSLNQAELLVSLTTVLKR